MKNIYSVYQVNQYIKKMFLEDYLLHAVWIKGEVSNLKYHSSGHVYFTLKDQSSAISCVMFQTYSQKLNFRMKDGQQVVVQGSVEVYERDGKYQIYVKEIIPEGAGALYEKLEQIKKDLKERGMFDSVYKRKIPTYIKTLGVVTAETGAAVRDIIEVSKKRNPYIRILVYPAIVQGDQAAQSIANGIRALENTDAEVIIVGRGGGSLEDLWAFNEELVAQAIFDCKTPIISAVGHETDTTIADFVADLRAATPSQAAELAVSDIQQIFRQMGQYEDTLKRDMKFKLQRNKEKALNMKRSLSILSPSNQIKEKRTYCLRLEEGLEQAELNLIRKKRHTFQLYLEKMKGLSPLEKLSQGFSYSCKLDGTSVHQIDNVQVGEMIKIQVQDGDICAEVKELIPDNRLQLWREQIGS